MLVIEGIGNNPFTVQVTDFTGTSSIFSGSGIPFNEAFLGFTSAQGIQQIEVLSTGGGPLVISSMFFEAITPVDALNDLITEIEGLGLTKPSEKSLTQKLNAAIKMLTDKNEKNDLNSCNKLDDFVNQVNAQEGKGLTTPQADSLRDSAQVIKNEIGCP